MLLNRYMRTRTVLFLDPGYWATGWLRPIKFEERAKTGDLVCRRALSLVAASELAGKSKSVKKGKK